MVEGMFARLDVIEIVAGEDGGKHSVESKVGYFDVKLYAAVRYLSILSSFTSNSSNYTSTNQQQLQSPLTLILHLLFTPSPTLLHKLLSLFKYYTYPILLSSLALVFKNLPLLSPSVSKALLQSSEKKNDKLIEQFFINISLVGNVLVEKFEKYREVEMEGGENYGRLVIGDIKEAMEQNDQVSGTSQQNKLTRILLWYVFRRVWRREAP